MPRVYPVAAVLSASFLVDKAASFVENVPTADLYDAAEFRYTSSRCVGQAFKAEDNWLGASCQYRNLCYDTQTDDFVYFKSEGDLVNHKTLYELRDGGVTGIEGKNGPRGVLRQAIEVSLVVRNTLWDSRFEAGMKYSPSVKEEHIPIDQTHWVEDGKTRVLYMQYNGHNVGHVMYDEMYPVYNLMKMFNLLSNDAEIMNWNKTVWPSQPDSFVVLGKVSR
jgi:hypothetical protein